MPGSDRYTRVKRVFLTAIGLPKGERTRFLNAECASDPALLTQVRKLLNVDERDNTFLEAPALQVPSTDLPLGTHLGRFRIDRILGEGGMGIVYQAQQDEPSRRVALKVIRPGILSPRLRSRFRHEIRILGQLRHPGIAQIYEAGTLDLAGDPVPYFAMELVEGRPLPECAATLDTRGRLALVAQICDAVHHAHQKGVIHRDLKPGNILVEEAASSDSSSPTAPPLQIKILDFGIARATDSDMRAVTVQTDIGQLVGTLAYMSPEQAAGDPDALDTRSDVYSIGVIAFELLAGRLPHAVQGLPLHEAARIVHDAEPTRLGSIDRALRGDVETIIAKALDRDSAHRYQSAAEFAADIRRYLRDEPIIARPASALYQLRRFARRHRPLVAATGLVLLALVAATVVSTWQARIALSAKALAESEKTRANLSADAARREARRAMLSAAAGAIEGGEPVSARQSLAGVPEQDRGWAWRYLDARLDDSIAAVAMPARIAGAWAGDRGARLIVVTEDGQVSEGSPWSLAPRARLAVTPVGPAALTADGRRIVAACGQDLRSLDVFSCSDGSLIGHIADLPARAALIVASADGSSICVAVKGVHGAPVADDVWFWGPDAPGRALRTGTRTTGIALNPDGRWLVTGFGDLACWDTSGAAPAWTKSLDREGAVFAISDDGNRIASGGGVDKSIQIWDRAADRMAAAVHGHSGDITALAFDPAGRTLASAGTDLTIRLWDAGTGAALGTLAGHTARIQSLRFTPDGSRLLSISDDGSVRLWQARPYEGACILRGHDSYVYAVAFTPDGSRIVSGAWDQTVRVWDAASGALLRTIPAAAGFITSLAVSDDGGRMATGHKIGEWEPAQVYLWDVESTAEVGRIPFGAGELHGLTFNHSGTRLWAGWEHAGVGTAEVMARPWSVRTLASGDPTHAVALSPDEQAVAHAGEGGRIGICDALSGHAIREWDAQSGAITSLAFSPTRPLLASGSADGAIRLWNSQTGDLVAKLDRHRGPVYCLAFSPDGGALASGSDDTTIRIWDTESGDELARLRGHGAYVYSLAFSPDGSRLASGSGDRTVRVWDTRSVRERWRARGVGQ